MLVLFKELQQQAWYEIHMHYLMSNAFLHLRRSTSSANLPTAETVDAQLFDTFR